jgi:hypothetical protein
LEIFHRLFHSRWLSVFVDSIPRLPTLDNLMLGGFGYVVLDAALPSKAILTPERHEGPIALLIMDVVMPKGT